MSQNGWAMRPHSLAVVKTVEQLQDRQVHNALDEQLQKHPPLVLYQTN